MMNEKRGEEEAVDLVGVVLWDELCGVMCT